MPSDAKGTVKAFVVKKVHMQELCDIKRDERYNAMIALMKQRLEKKK